MGLFDFAKEFGKKLFGKDDDPADKIRQHIEESNPGVDPFSVSYNEGVVSLSGQANSQDAYEKVILMAGNVKGVTEVSAEGLSAPEPKVNVEYYVIESGDTLSKIAKQYYGNAMDYPKIFEANREVIKDPDLIYPGQKIRIPQN
ncbi:MAG: peptidoglycan-binding protein LysM [Gammaproteobacteria bacterium]